MKLQSSLTYRVAGSITVVVLAVAILACIGYLKYSSIMTQMAAPPPPEPAVSVSLTEAVPTSFRRSTNTIGTVLAPQSIQLRTELTGVITEIPMVSGSVVEAGDVLVQLDVSVEQAQLKGALAAKQIADSTLRRNREAARLNAITDLEVEQAEASMAQAEAEIERLRALIAKKTLRAPFKSKVGLFDWHVGQYLPEGSVVTTLQGVEGFAHIDFSVPQHVADYVNIGQSIKLLTTQSTLEAKVIAMDSQADRVTRSVLVRAKLDQPPATLQPNDSVKVVVEYGDAISAVAVPATAIRRTPTGSMVYLAKLDQSNSLRAESRPVALLTASGDVAVISTGLQVGERIVADGSFKVRDAALLADVNAAVTPSASQAAQDSAATQVSNRPSEETSAQ